MDKRNNTIQTLIVGLLVIGTIAIGAITINILHNNQLAQDKIGAPQGSFPATTPVSNTTGKTATVDKYTLAQIALHNAPSNCWIIISNKIYSVSSFLNQHPGGAGAITPYCGKDATIAFQTHGSPGGSNHSAFAYSLLTSYYLAPVSSGSAQNSKAPVTPTKPPTTATYIITVTPSINGIVISNPSGIACGSTCSATFNPGTLVTLSAVASSGYIFSGWSSTTCSGTGSCSLTMNSNQTLSANFTLEQTPPPSNSGSGYTASQVATHNTRSDCWLIISGKVYNVTNFISQHPGGVNAIVSRCGTDATTAFTTNSNGGHAHSAYAQSLLPTYFVGNIDSGGVLPAPTPTAPATNGGRNNRDD